MFEVGSIVGQKAELSLSSASIFRPRLSQVVISSSTGTDYRLPETKHNFRESAWRVWGKIEVCVARIVQLSQALYHMARTVMAQTHAWKEVVAKLNPSPDTLAQCRYMVLK